MNQTSFPRNAGRSIAYWMALALGCSAQTPPMGGDAGTAGVGTGGSPGTQGGGDGGGGLKLDVGTNMSDFGGDGCAEVSEMATNNKQPADIILVVDNSGSMGEENEGVQNNLNDFSTQIVAAGIDVHVVLLSSFPGEPDEDDDWGQARGICIDPPLGSGGCPTEDNNPPVYTHVDVEIGSNDGLVVLLGQHSNWQGAMRADARKHVVIVTDDESELSDTSFDSMFKALDPSYADYVFHAIAVPDDPEAACDNGGACCELGEQQGVVYQALVGATGGVFGNLCLQDFQGVFEELAKSVEQGSSLSCEWTIPPAPAGMPFDPDKVNVEFSDGMGNTLQFGRVDSEAECAGVADGWYYDDPANPTKIVACSQTCDKIRDVEGGSITIKFGCATQPAG